MAFNEGRRSNVNLYMCAFILKEKVPLCGEGAEETHILSYPVILHSPSGLIYHMLKINSGESKYVLTNIMASS